MERVSGDGNQVQFNSFSSQISYAYHLGNVQT